VSEGGTLVYAYVTYMLFYLVYSFLNIPFGSLAGVMSQLPDERAKLSSARTVGAALAIILLAFVVSPQLTRAGNLQRSLTVTTIVFAVVGVALYLTLFATSREKVERDTGVVSLKQTFSTIRENRPLVLLCVNALFVLTGLFTLQTLQVYYARDVLGKADYVIVLTVVSVGGMVLTAPLLPRIVRAFGKKRAYVVCGILTVVGSVGIALSPPSIPVLAFISFAVYGVGLAVVQALMWTLEADTVEYGEWKRCSYRGQQLRPAVLRPQGRAGDRRRDRGLGDRIRRVCRGGSDAVDHGTGHDPVGRRRRPGRLRRDRCGDHAGLPAHRAAVPGDGERGRPTARSPHRRRR
jgi:glucuronide carrier protein